MVMSTHAYSGLYSWYCILLVSGIYMLVHYKRKLFSIGVDHCTGFGAWGLKRSTASLSTLLTFSKISRIYQKPSVNVIKLLCAISILTRNGIYNHSLSIAKVCEWIALYVLIYILTYNRQFGVPCFPPVSECPPRVRSTFRSDGTCSNVSYSNI